MKRHPTTGCRTESLFGPWFIEPGAHASLVELAKRFDLRQIAQLNAEARAKADAVPDDDEPAPTTDDAARAKERPPYALKGGVAVIDIIGPTTKYPTSFQELLGGTSTLLAGNALRHAVRNPDVKVILIHFQTPGGTVDGAFDFVDEIRKADAVKPVYGHASDHCTSGGMLFSAQCRRLTANRNALLGSIGVRSELVDTSKGLEMAGVRVIPVVSGRHKAVGVGGKPVTKDDVAYMQGIVDALNELFVADVAGPRRLTAKFLRGLEAGVFGAAEALGLNLIDGIANFEEVADALRVTTTHPPARGAGVARV